MMNNAIRMAEVDYGPQNTWTDYYVDQDYDDNGNLLYDKGDKIDVIVKKYFAPYLKITGSKEFKEVSSPQKVYYLSDGSAFGFYLHANRELLFYVEDPERCVNKDNTANTCAYIFAFIPYTANVNRSLFKYNFSNGMQPNLYKWDGEKESLVSGCKDNYYGYCLELIRQNGWKIPENFPIKF